MYSPPQKLQTRPLSLSCLIFTITAQKQVFLLLLQKHTYSGKKSPCNVLTVPKKTIPGSSNTPKHQISSVPMTVVEKQIFF